MSLRAAIRWELRLARRVRAVRVVLLLLVASLAVALWSGLSYRERWEDEVARHHERGADERKKQVAKLEETRNEKDREIESFQARFETAYNEREQIRRDREVEVKNFEQEIARTRLRIEDKSRANLLILQVQILGRGVSLEVDGSLLDVIDDPQTTGWLSEEYPPRSRQR